MTDKPDETISVLAKRELLKTYPFTVEELDLEICGVARTRPAHRISCPDWVNVLPITPDRQAILIRQPRYGSVSFVLETPGGVIDPGERDPTMAALRELEEETGFSSQRILPLASINPNPAINDNRCHFFVALDCRPQMPRHHFPDPDERISLKAVMVSELDALVRTGQINHALSALCIMLAGRYLNL